MMSYTQPSLGSGKLDQLLLEAKAQQLAESRRERTRRTDAPLPEGAPNRGAVARYLTTWAGPYRLTARFAAERRVISDVPGSGPPIMRDCWTGSTMFRPLDPSASPGLQCRNLSNSPSAVEVLVGTSTPPVHCEAIP